MIETSPSPSTMSRDPLRMSGSNLHSTQRLLKDLFHRVVALEQKNRQIEILNVNIREQIRQLKLKNDRDEENWEMLGKTCNGKFVWKIVNFSDQYQKMLQNNQYVIYSHPFYTSPFGYKVRYSHKVPVLIKYKFCNYTINDKIWILNLVLPPIFRCAYVEIWKK